MEGYRELRLKKRGKYIDVVTIVDEDRYDHLNQFNWGLSKNNYVRGQIECGVQVFMHRYLTDCIPKDGKVVDHRNHNTLDNRVSNLRVHEGHIQNLQNTSSAKGSSSKYRGVCWDKQTNKWKAYGQLGEKKYSLGRFISEDEAAECARMWRLHNMPHTIEGVS